MEQGFGHRVLGVGNVKSEMSKVRRGVSTEGLGSFCNLSQWGGKDEG